MSFCHNTGLMQDEKTMEMSGSRYSEPSNSMTENTPTAKGKGIKAIFKKPFRKNKENSDSSPAIDRFHMRTGHTASSPTIGNCPAYMFSEPREEDVSYQEQFMQINKERQEMIRKFEAEIKDLKGQLEAEKVRSAIANKLVEDMMGGNTQQKENKVDNSNNINIDPEKQGIDDKSTADDNTHLNDTNNNNDTITGNGVRNGDVVTNNEKENTSVVLVKKLTEENGNLSIKLRESENRIIEAENQIKSLKLNIKMYLEENNSYKQMSERSRQKIIELSDINEKLNNDLQTKHKELDAANQSLKQMEIGGAEINKLRHEIQDLKAKIKTTEEKLESEQTNSGMITKELDAARQECATLKAEKERSILDKANRQGQINTLATQLSETENQRQKLETELSNLTDNYEKLQRDFDKQKEEIRTLANADTQLKTARCETTQLKKELENERNNIKILSTSLTNLSQKFGNVSTVDRSVAGLTSTQKDQLITYYVYNGRAKPEEIIQMIVDASKDKSKKGSSKDNSQQQARIQRDILEETLIQNMTLKTNLEAVSGELETLLASLGVDPNASGRGDVV